MDKLCLPPLNHLNPPVFSIPSITHSPTSPSLPSQLSASLPSSLPLISSVGKLKTLNSVKVLHTQIIKMANRDNSVSLVENLITYYLQFEDFRSASKLFIVGFERNLKLWSSFLEEFTSFGGSPREILEVFSELHNAGVVFDARVLTVVLRICSSLKGLWLGVELHACLFKRGFDLNAILMCALLDFYGTCWGIECAGQVFYEMSDREVLWSEALMLNLKNHRWIEALELFRNMNFSLVKSTSSSITKLLHACGKVGALDGGKQIHGYVLRRALESNISICNSLITMYSRSNKLGLARNVFNSMKDHNLSSWNAIISSYAAFGFLDDAWNLFNKMDLCDTNPDIVTWNCLLSGHSLNGSYVAAISIFQRMQSAGFKPNSSSITSVLQAVTDLKCFKFGKEIHCFVMRNGLDKDVYVGTALIDMYIKNDCLKSAQAVFNNMKNKNIFAWNSLISGYSFKGLFEDAEKLLSCMGREGIKPDLVTWKGLVTGYAMWGRNKEALAVINRIKNSGLRPSVVSWTALIAGSKNENYLDALKFFIQMQKEGIKPNTITISSLLRVCAGLSLLRTGEEIHCLSIRNGFVEDVSVSTALVDMYSKAGNFRSASKVFRKIENKTSATWNCMIMGFSIYSFGKEAICLFDEMCEAGVQPDAITFTALLSGCNNSGLVNEGWQLFDSMKKDYNINPTIEHCSCMVDLLGKSGYLDEAWDFIQTMPLEPDATMWGALLKSCQTHRNIEFAEIAAKNLFKLEPYNAANYVMMMNIYAISNRWEDVERLRNLMRSVGVRIRHMWSWIQIDQRIHRFSAEGKPHPEVGEIYLELYQLVLEMKKMGYVPDTSCVHQNIDEVEKEKVLMSHTEKLAITYGLMKTSGKAPIRVIKNTRVCSDCHTAAKFMSLIAGREIVLKDGLRFHHFREGKCSCKDCH